MSSKFKVLQVIPRLGYGGAETGCYDLAHFLAEQDCKSYVAVSGGELLKFVRKEKVKINYESLEVVKAYDDWGSEDMTAVDKAITDGKTFVG